MDETLYETLSVLPFSFWFVIMLLAGGAWWAKDQMREGLGLPMILVLATVAAWYVVDPLYNGYVENFVSTFTPEAMDSAWWQVVLFIAAFLVLAPMIHRSANARELNRSSQVLRLLKTGVNLPLFQSRLHPVLQACVVLFVLLSIVAGFRLGDQILYYFFPFLGYQANPWSRGRLGAGYDSLLTLASYVQMFIAGVFGIMLALVQNPKLRALALAGCLLTWPFFLFDRTRNNMLVVAIPAILAWVLLRLRIGMVQKGVLLAGFFLLIYAWFGFVMVNRADVEISSAFSSEGFDVETNSKVHQAGLNMFEELCWINTFIETGRYKPNWGQRYFAELVNPVPRALWPGKPLIGIDYAILRGQGYDSGDAADAGVGATISTGMIGQGVVNFGRVLGPAFAALLMSIWATILARLDLRGQEMGQLLLYGVGLVLTFNLGRDITLITLYTFVFGAVVVWLADHFSQKPSPKRIQGVQRTPQANFQQTLKSSRVPSEVK